MQDYSWQNKAEERFVEAVISALNAACGTGKTRAETKIAIRKHLPVLVITLDNLTEQWKEAITEIAGEDQKIWVHDEKLAKKNPSIYFGRFVAWLKELSDDKIR